MGAYVYCSISNMPLDDQTASTKCGYFLRAQAARVAPKPDPYKITSYSKP